MYSQFLLCISGSQLRSCPVSLPTPRTQHETGSTPSKTSILPQTLIIFLKTLNLNLILNYFQTQQSLLLSRPPRPTPNTSSPLTNRTILEKPVVIIFSYWVSSPNSIDNSSPLAFRHIPSYRIYTLGFSSYILSLSSNCSTRRQSSPRPHSSSIADSSLSDYTHWVFEPTSYQHNNHHIHLLHLFTHFLRLQRFHNSDYNALPTPRELSATAEPHSPSSRGNKLFYVSPTNREIIIQPVAYMPRR
ncbi:hypothetical protein BZA77DRAFT_55713 [Pyronema omphalodes]|nr:hypothetical protein BZA77DRAFT_55713 [Pyronema omphalodes]